jgi:hypothetical protein
MNLLLNNLCRTWGCFRSSDFGLSNQRLQRFYVFVVLVQRVLEFVSGPENILF